MEYINDKLIAEVAKNQNISVSQVKTVLALLEEGNTVPFIARYRKEKTGSLDEEEIRAIQKEYEYSKNLQDRKEDIIRLIDEKGMLTEELRSNILAADKLVDVEDIYRPFKEKKKTKATEAIKKGLEPLADLMLTFPKEGDLDQIAKAYLNEEVLTVEEAYEGAKHIIAEKVSDNADYRKWIREYTYKNGFIASSVKKNAEDEYQTYQIYYDYEEKLSQVKLHRILAINRAEKEKVISCKINIDTEDIFRYLNSQVIQGRLSIFNEMIDEAIVDGYKRLISGSIEREIRSDLSEKAEDQAIHLFSENLRSLLLQPPLKGQMVLGVDPAFRTGCKMAIIDKFGKYLTKDVIYPHEAYPGAKVHPQQLNEARKKVIDLLKKYPVNIIAIGNGTASRETEKFIVDLLKENQLSIKYVIVDEAGASVYSASPLARDEFPDFQVEERSAVSIARRIQDPLSELVKIDPKSIGVGQYQHDVTQNKLNDSLTFVVSTAVNQVGVNVNTASQSLLQFVSGLSEKVAKNIVAFREENGPFTDRKKIKKVKNVGEKTFEQAIGFLRIFNSKNPLDKTPIHPESYDLANDILDYLALEAKDIGSKEMKEAVDKVSVKELATKFKQHEILIQDILEAFASPTRDIRDDYPQPLLKSDLLSLEDLRPGMEMQGTVRNVVDFGAFVDVGIKEAGLVHISKLSKNFVNHPLDVVSVGNIVKVWVLSVDVNRKRLQLSMIKPD
ncbi:RNA-binding transcriptional accessory protein [Hujiaoplasma nucleasis]|uniref:RNA-binding transcriptional accessory protein n=1 Tax=Hujiaoplasma nucleasis TaxID=2725268 RepID=A0A7L6N2M2_9MOLU|nr:Tex family protein [Hujiaoplasma nucleasis]QLY40510.1 RNA-binding transcriptional accessory protein [Hujiaoplasma nucleasis]